MFRIVEEKIHDLDGIKVMDSFGKEVGLICLEQGGSLQQLTLKGFRVIKDMHPLSYENTYASSILFPFANRIRDGRFRFRESEYQLPINDRELNNAMHGFVYDKRFVVDKKECSEEGALLQLAYEAVESVGFPFKYSIKLVYKWIYGSLSLRIQIKNTGSTAFPFTIGWHPYFYSGHLDKSSIKFDGAVHYKYDQRQLPVRAEIMDHQKTIYLKEKSLDDGYHMKSNHIHLTTPEYELKISSSSKENYLQLYTSPQPNFVAIEPMTGAVDAMNSGDGLQELEPHKTYEVTYLLEVK